MASTTLQGENFTLRVTFIMCVMKPWEMTYLTVHSIMYHPLGSCTRISPPEWMIMEISGEGQNAEVSDKHEKMRLMRRSSCMENSR
jgi:hypothetical protein